MRKFSKPMEKTKEERRNGEGKKECGSVCLVNFYSVLSQL
jgi:hypothetical protein